MRVKKYVAPSMPEAMKKIRAELGTDAVILNSKKVQSGGFLGLFKKSHIEVVAGIDPSPLSTNRTERKLPTPVESKEQPMVEDSIMKELQQMKQLIAKQNGSGQDVFPVSFQKVYEHLMDQDVNEQIAYELVMTIMDRESSTDISASYVAVAVKQEIIQQLKGLSFTEVADDSKVIHFVGPTGVGKTTTLAKIAAQLMLEKNKQVAFITMDTYRIAAIDQLKTYAQILDVPIKVAYNYEEYTEAINEFSAYDHILVDTAGRNYREEEHLENIAQIIKNHNSYLVLSLTAKPKDIADIYATFESLKINQVIFTKIDETTQYGSILNILFNHDVNASYGTNGQNVPSDIIRLSPEEISQMIMDGFIDE
ncbi:MAG TPA: flagellar biosynthesis protein FlhF [Bacillota bacterium]|nr:flagellar biosynthesis protein FlhF [Bacillota bacterium]